VAIKEERLRNEAQDRAEAEARAKEELETNLYYHRIALAHRELSMDNLGRAQKLLDDCPPGLRQWEWYYLTRLCRLDPFTFTDKAQVKSVAFSADGDRLACAGGDRNVKVLNSRTGAMVQTLGAQTDVVNSVVFHPGGKHLASAGADGEVRVWDLATGEVVFTCPVFDGSSNGTTWGRLGGSVQPRPRWSVGRLGGGRQHCESLEQRHWDARPKLPRSYGPRLQRRVHLRRPTPGLGEPGRDREGLGLDASGKDAHEQVNFELSFWLSSLVMLFQQICPELIRLEVGTRKQRMDRHFACKVVHKRTIKRANQPGRGSRMV
jgi:hypothetical protein